MSRRRDVQDATGRLEYISGLGTTRAWGNLIGASDSSGNPINGVTGFAPSCTWQNPHNGGIWVNLGTFTSAAWVRIDGGPSTGIQFGASALTSNFATFRPSGNIYANAGNPVASNPANTTEDILDGFVLPANALSAAGRGLMIAVSGSSGATGNNKRVRIYLNPTMSGQTVSAAGVISGGTVTSTSPGALLLDSGTQTTNAGGFYLSIEWFKYGAANSNTQVSSFGQIVFGTTHGGAVAPAATTIPENAAINIVITGASQTTGAAADVVLNTTLVQAMN